MGSELDAGRSGQHAHAALRQAVRGLAVEPMTCPANVFATATDVWRIELGETRTASWGLDIGDP